MKKTNGFSVAELTVVIIILALICSFYIPTIIKESAAKVRTTQYYAAYKTLADGTKHVKLSSPTHDLSVLRGGKFRVNACDLFADTFSVTVDKKTKKVKIGDEVTEIQKDMSTKMICPDGDIAGPGGCTGKTVALGDRCQDGSIPTCLDGDSCADNEKIYCRVLPQLLNNYDNCDDLTYTYDMDYDSNWSYGTSAIPDDFFKNSDKYGLEISDKTNFDTAIPNFSTLNGMRFFGLDKYPAEQFCSSDVTSLEQAKEAGCLQYKTVYIDTNGKSNTSKREEKCANSCSTNAKLGDGAELSNNANNCLECMRSNFGVYKFLLYNDGRIEPLTNRDETGDERVRFILSYVKNGEVIQVPDQFKTYQSARDYKLNPAERFIYLKKTERSTGEEFNKQANWDTVDVSYPCKEENDFSKHQCEIKLITPEMQLSQSLRSE